MTNPEEAIHRAVPEHVRPIAAHRVKLMLYGNPLRAADLPVQMPATAHAKHHATTHRPAAAAVEEAADARTAQAVAPASARHPVTVHAKVAAEISNLNTHSHVKEKTPCPPITVQEDRQSCIANIGYFRIRRYFDHRKCLQTYNSKGVQQTLRFGVRSRLYQDMRIR